MNWRRFAVTLLALLSLVAGSYAQTSLSGALSGTYSAGLYNINGAIMVPAGTTVTLLPGVHFQFNGWYALDIQGTLLANGTATDSIIFDCNLNTNPGKWHGLRFNGASASGSQLSYCRISYGKAQMIGSDAYGGGLYCNLASPTLSHCRISNCSATADGGGLYFAGSNALLDHCLIDHNSSPVNGGGIQAASSNLTLKNSIISYNTANDGGGIYLSGSIGSTNSAIENCLIDHNSSTGT